MSRDQGSMDDFWDLKKLVSEVVPEKNVKPQITSQKAEPRTVLFPIADSSIPQKNANEYKASSITSFSLANPSSVYEPASKPFLLNVSLTPSGLNSASDFEAEIRRYKDVNGSEVPFIHFYSFSPVYRNLSPEALRYYFWWRTSFSEGNALPASWSYLSLYLSELVNSEEEDSEEKYLLMWKLLEVYGDPQTALYIPDVSVKLPEILCDYSLIHGLTVPHSVSEKTVCAAAENARFREAFFDSGHPASLTVLLTRFCSDYDYEKSKFVPQIRIPNAVNFVYGAVKFSSDKAIAEKYEHPLAGVYREKTTITRYSYANLIFVLPKYTYIIKADFCSSNRSYVLRNTITGIVKHCENRFRAHSGIKSKLRVFSLEPFFRDAVDEYLNAALPAVKITRTEKKKPEPEYEKFYELPETEFSLDKAKEIEKRSWIVTDRLTDGMDEYKIPVETPSEPQNKQISLPRHEPVSDLTPTESELSQIIALCPECKDFLYAVYNESYGKAAAECEKLGVPVSVLADRVNSAAFDVIGDTLIEESASGTFEIISDYRYIFEAL